jgi:hypothetical protein
LRWKVWGQYVQVNVVGWVDIFVQFATFRGFLTHVWMVGSSIARPFNPGTCPAASGTIIEAQFPYIAGIRGVNESRVFIDGITKSNKSTGHAWG